VTALLLQPHSDDAALFAAFTCLHHRPHVITVLSSQLQEDRGTGISQATREAEDRCAMEFLGCTVEQWPYSDASPDWGAVENALRLYDEREAPERVFAPRPTPDGHEQHNAVGSLALDVFGDTRVTLYLTYRRGHGRAMSGNEVAFKPHWPGLKLRALACYVSQIQEPSTRDWFLDLSLREWYA
jgi:LmbE family N-acetylglucosaminyl deacetylase